MATTTWGVKVSEELKAKITEVMQGSGMVGEEFIEQLLTLYVAQSLKQEKPGIALELEELQKLTQRIYSIYFNSIQRTDTLLESKEETYTNSLSEKDAELQEVRNSLYQKTKEAENLQEVINSLQEELTEAHTTIGQLQATAEARTSAGKSLARTGADTPEGA